MAKVYRTGVGVVMEKELLLHEAVISNEAEAVRKILDDGDGLNVDCRNNYGRGPIHLAASRGNLEILDMLIKAKCDIEAKDKFGMRALHMAAWYGQPEAVDLLLEAGATATAVDKKQRTLLMMASRSSSSSSSGGGALLERVASRACGQDAAARDCEGCTALHHAARAGEAAAVSTLGRLLPELELEARDQRGRTALLEACAGGQQEAAARLLELGASPLERDREGCTVLHLAVASREFRLCGWLLGQASLSRELLRARDRRGYGPLHLAASLGCSLILGELLAALEAEPGQLEVRCALEGNAPLHLAARHNQAQALELLLQAGSCLHALNNEMQTPLQLATAMGHGEVCRLLVTAAEKPRLEHEPEPARDNTAIHQAAKSSLASIANIVARTARLDYPALLLRGTRALFNSPNNS